MAKQSLFSIDSTSAWFLHCPLGEQGRLFGEESSNLCNSKVELYAVLKSKQLK